MFPLVCIATAEPTDLSGSTWLIPLIAVATLLVVSAIALVPLVIARQRLLQNREWLVALVILWTLLVCGSLISFTTAQLKWSQERRLLINTGYYDPHDNSGAPPYPWPTWSALAATYAGLIAYSLGRRPT